MSISTLHPRRLFLFAGLSLLDLALTYKVVHSGGGYVYESNPIANEWLIRFGWTGLAFYKVLAMSIAVFSVILVSLNRPRTGSRLLNFACLAVSVVVVYSFSLSNVIGKSLTAEYPRTDHVGGLDQEARLQTIWLPDDSAPYGDRECFLHIPLRDQAAVTQQVEKNLKELPSRPASLPSGEALQSELSDQ